MSINTVILTDIYVEVQGSRGRKVDLIRPNLELGDIDCHTVPLVLSCLGHFAHAKIKYLTPTDSGRWALF